MTISDLRWRLSRRGWCDSESGGAYVIGITPASGCPELAYLSLDELITHNGNMEFVDRCHSDDDRKMTRGQRARLRMKHGWETLAGTLV